MERKEYEVNGIIIGTYEEENHPIKLSLYDDELEQIKALIKQHPECNDLMEILKDDFPDLYEIIHSELRDAAYEFYEKEYWDYDAEGPDDEPDIELMGDEYKCPIPEDWK